MATCGSCNSDIKVCPLCEGQICTPGCEDRFEDGCTCDDLSDEIDEPDADDLEELDTEDVEPEDEL